MKALLQRVSRAEISVAGRGTAGIGRGLLVFLCVMAGDGEEDLQYLARKVANLRIFPDGEGKMNLSVLDISGEALVVSQFTLAADTSRGNRPAFTSAEAPKRAEELYEEFASRLRGLGVNVSTGEFSAHMSVTLENDGPVTIMLDSRG